ncbi:hypothetical protein SAMN05421858_4812 [Haladaptatus litoreus]|uniref:Uncharacterized protein n=1 Tax=Haladaptatus litoreus TaxID=553468 RepID=A0A1N7F8Q5_9EURY|nr:hypothetical protein SAMN05421858_4812 [Haladaptatus litoreus]
MGIPRRWLALLLVGCLCLTAGCNSLLPGSDPQTSTTSTLQGQLAPGLTAQGVTDIGALTDAHARILQEDSYTVSWTNVQRYSNRTVRYQSHGQTQRGPSSTHFYSQTRFPTPPPTFASFTLQHYEYYGKKDTVYQRYIGQNNTTVEVFNRSEAPVAKTFTSREYFYAVLNAFNQSQGFIVTERPNTSSPRYKVQLTRLERPALVVNYHGLETVTNASLTATIDRWGVIHKYQLIYTGQTKNQTVSGSRTVRFTRIGSTQVPQPAWIHNVTTNQSVTGEDDR